MEDLRVQDGEILTSRFSTYLLADPHGPFGARGVAELPLVPFLPAVAIAIHDAVGVWVTQQPFTPERVLTAIMAAAEQAAAEPTAVV
jgi:CO/xanthine dehydrogenase Mo-binding subunit